MAQAEENLELLLPQIAWHDNRGAIQSVDASPASGLIATAGNDNEVRLWRLSQNGVVSFVQALTGHTKVRPRDAVCSHQHAHARARA